MPAFPELVKDIVPGISSSAPENLTVFNDKLFFSAFTSSSGQELWVSDGTAAGTQLVKDISPGSGSSTPQDLTVFNGKLFFTAKDSSATGRELWVSDGTATGTQLLKDIYQGPPYVLEDDNDPTGLTVYNGRLFFSANNGINGRELWSTDGTTAGTQLFKDINPGSNSSSIPFSSDPTNFIAFNGKLIFSAIEQNTSRELWISDGTAAGTQLLKDISSGPQSFFWGSVPSNLTVLGNKLFFTATESGIANGTGEELWVTDGTAAGTQLVKDIRPGNDSFPRGLTVLNGKIVFSATDGTSGQELWVSDGTAAGTQLVKDIYPSDPIIRSSDPQNLTAYNGKVFFSAEDGINGREVWSSDGTAAGTQLLKVITPGTGSFNPIGFTVFDGKLFISIGGELWASDGTTAGTQVVSNIFFDSSGSRPGNFTILGDKLLFTAGTLTSGSRAGTGVELWKIAATTPSVTIPPTNRYDFNGDGKSDILWRNGANGSLTLWQMNGTQLLQDYVLPTIADTNWFVASLADFTGDGKADILWRNRANGGSTLWEMSGTRLKQDYVLPTITDLNWDIVNVSDFTGDGKADILWRNRANGGSTLWEMNGTRLRQDYVLPTITDLNWSVVGVADFTGDGKADILWRNRANGGSTLWEMNGTRLTQDYVLPTITDLNWSVVGVADFTGDGKADILWRNRANGGSTLWEMNGTRLTQDYVLPTITDLNWGIVNVSDFTGDGKADILWRNRANGGSTLWEMNGTRLTQDYVLPTITDLNWEVQG